MSKIYFKEIESKLRSYFDYGEDVSFSPIVVDRWYKDEGEWKMDFAGIRVHIGWLKSHYKTLRMSKKEFMKLIGIKGEFKYNL